MKFTGILSVSKMNSFIERSSLVTGSFVFLSGLIQGCSERSTNENATSGTNIIILLADDMGYSDPACYGGPSATPVMDEFAANGIRFTNFYAAAPNCSPSRTGLLTGRSPAIVGMYNYQPPGHPMHLPAREKTLAEILKSQSYQTVHLGKWHLGCLPQDSSLMHPQPSGQGFDYSLGTENNAQPSHLNPVNFIRNGQPTGEIKGYSCQILIDEAISWFNTNYDPSAPFFMYVAFHEPHRKIASPPGLVEKYSSLPIKDAEYLANIENLDIAIGRLMSFLKEKDLVENTLILFSSDNGSYRQSSNGELRAVKSYLYDGGIRVPGIVHWPALKVKGKIIDEPAGLIDVVPTLCDILEIEPDPAGELDGTSLLNIFRGEKFKRKKPLYWFYYRTTPEIAIRLDSMMIMGKDRDTIPRSHHFTASDMKYIREMDLDDFEIYNLTDDKSEDRNLYPFLYKSSWYIDLLNEKLDEIQAKGKYWDNLPPAEGERKPKAEWVRYRR